MSDVVYGMFGINVPEIPERNPITWHTYHQNAGSLSTIYSFRGMGAQEVDLGVLCRWCVCGGGGTVVVNVRLFECLGSNRIVGARGRARARARVCVCGSRLHNFCV